MDMTMTKTKNNYGRFLLLWAGEFASSIGGGLTSFGLGLYIYNLTGSATHMSLLTLLGFLPGLLLKVPAGTQDGKTFRFKDLGAPNVKRQGTRGALYVTVRVKVPTRLTTKERDALAALRDGDTRTYREDVEKHGA